MNSSRSKLNSGAGTASFPLQQSMPSSHGSLPAVFQSSQQSQQLQQQHHQQLSLHLPQQQQMFNLQQQTRLPFNLTIRYGDQKENRIENVERNRKMNLLLSHPELPESARIEVPSELRADQKEWNKAKKEAEAPSQRRYRLELTVLNEDKAKVEQCSKCRKSNESKTRSFVRVRSSHIYCKNKSISLPVKFGCIPSHQDNRPKELFIEIKLIAESIDRLEFYSLVPLRFRKHKRKRSNASKIASPITSPTTLSPLTSPRGIPQQWALQQLSQDQSPPNYWSNIEEGPKLLPMTSYPPSSTGHYWTDMSGPFSHEPETSDRSSINYHSHHYGIKSEHHDIQQMIESPLHSPYYLSGPGSPYSPHSGYNSPPYDEFDFTGAAQISSRLMEAGRPNQSEIDQLPMYLQKLRLQELEDKNKRLEDENAACKRMLDECKRVLKTATMEIERLNYKLARKTEEASAERRSKEMAHKQLEELKTQRFMMGSGSKLGGLVKPESTKNNPFAVKEDIGAIRKGLKPVVGEWPTVGSPPQQQDPTTLEFTCKARLSSAFAQGMPFITTVNGSPVHPSQGQQTPTQTQPQFTFGIYNSPPSSWS